MWQWLASFLTAPIINGLISAYKAKLEAGNTSANIAAGLAARELAVQQAEIEAQNQLKIAEIGHWYEPEHLFGYIMVVYFGKIVIWDKVLAWGSTDALRGDAATWGTMVFAFYVGMRGFQNIVRIIKR